MLCALPGAAIDYYVTVDTGKHVGMLERPRATECAVNLFRNNWEQRGRIATSPHERFETGQNSQTMKGFPSHISENGGTTPLPNM